MTSRLQPSTFRRFQPWSLILAVVAIAILSAACQQPAVSTPVTAGLSPTPLATPTGKPVVLKTLKTSPETGYVGTTVTVTGDGLPPGKAAQIVWVTVDGSYLLNQNTETIEYVDRQFTDKRTSVVQTSIDGTGHLTASFSVPEDYGETHDIYAVVDGQDVAKGGFSIVRNVTIAPQEGAVGTPITITVKGLGWTPYANTLAVLYDDHYAGFISAVTTHGTAQARIRAAGSSGVHSIRITDASGAVPYLNAEQSPRKLPQFEFTFDVTRDAGSLPAALDWPDDTHITVTETVTKTTQGNQVAMPSTNANLSPSTGPILSKTILHASSLPPDATLDLLWVSVKGNRVSPSGWNLITLPLGQTTTSHDGSLTTDLEIPDDLGGWHMVDLVQGQKVLTEVPFLVTRSLVSVSPTQVKAGDEFTIEIKGVGWTELDNGIAVTYDNAYAGYACGFNSQGDVTLHLTASGSPGTHLIDLYPMIFLGHGKGPWDYDLPQLTLQDQPGLALGYRLPAFRLAIQVMP